MHKDITIGVLALQGAFYEHVKLLRQAIVEVTLDQGATWKVVEVRTPQELEDCDALIIPGGESTTVSLVAARSNLLEPLREFVKYVLSTLLEPFQDVADAREEYIESRHGEPALD